MIADAIYGSTEKADTKKKLICPHPCATSLLSCIYIQFTDGISMYAHTRTNTLKISYFYTYILSLSLIDLRADGYLEVLLLSEARELK